MHPGRRGCLLAAVFLFHSWASPDCTDRRALMVASAVLGNFFAGLGCRKLDQLAERLVSPVTQEHCEDLPAPDAIPPQLQARSACARQLSSRVGLCAASSTYNRIPRRYRVRRRTPKWRAPGAAAGSLRRLLARFSRLVFYGPWSLHLGETRSMTAHIGGFKAEAVNPNRS
jgi:hypothetical protein